MNYRKVNWDNFQLGGHDSKAKVRFKVKEKPDRRDNAEESRISNAYARRFKVEKQNERRFKELPEHQQQEILKALGL